MSEHCILYCELLSHAISPGGEQLVHLVPSGTFKGRDGRGPFTLADANAVIQASREFAGTRQIPIDYEHQIDFAAKNGKPAPAAGWIKGLQARADGIWGQVKWTKKAAQHIASGEYRYISPVLFIAKGEIKYLPRAALTNTPNLNELTALFSTNTQTATEENSMKEFLAKLAKILGLEDGADESSIITAIQDLTASPQSGAIDPSQFVPIGEFERVVAEVNSLNQGVVLQAAQAHVNTQIINGNMPPYLKDWGIALCGVNKPAFDAFIHRTKGLFNRLTTQVVFNSQLSGQAAPLTDDEKEVCMRMGITAEELAKSKTFLETAKG